MARGNWTQIESSKSKTYVQLNGYIQQSNGKKKKHTDNIKRTNIFVYSSPKVKCRMNDLMINMEYNRNCNTKHCSSQHDGYYSNQNNRNCGF